MKRAIIPAIVFLMLFGTGNALFAASTSRVQIGIIINDETTSDIDSAQKASIPVPSEITSYLAGKGFNASLLSTSFNSWSEQDQQKFDKIVNASDGDNPSAVAYIDQVVYKVLSKDLSTQDTSSIELLVGDHVWYASKQIGDPEPAASSN